MISRSIQTYTELSALLAEHGYDYKVARLSMWVHGAHAAENRFPSALAEVLELDAEERAKLAEAFTYGQHVPITERYKERPQA